MQAYINILIMECVALLNVIYCKQTKVSFKMNFIKS
jgi:hypothetical protein